MQDHSPGWYQVKCNDVKHKSTHHAQRNGNRGYPHVSVTARTVSLYKTMLITFAFEQCHKIETLHDATQGCHYFLLKSDKTMIDISVTAAYWITH